VGGGLLAPAPVLAAAPPSSGRYGCGGGGGQMAESLGFGGPGEAASVLLFRCLAPSRSSRWTVQNAWRRRRFGLRNPAQFRPGSWFPPFGPDSRRQAGLRPSAQLRRRRDGL
jgi:hypothetical protein